MGGAGQHRLTEQRSARVAFRRWPGRGLRGSVRDRGLGVPQLGGRHLELGLHELRPEAGVVALAERDELPGGVSAPLVAPLVAAEVAAVLVGGEPAEAVVEDTVEARVLTWARSSCSGRTRDSST